jgi:hypothetical protein
VHVFVALGGHALEAARLPIGHAPLSPWAVAVGPAASATQDPTVPGAAQGRGGKPVRADVVASGWQGSPGGGGEAGGNRVWL